MGRLRQRIHIQKIFIQGLKGDWRILCANSDGVTNSKRLSKLLFAFFFFLLMGQKLKWLNNVLPPEKVQSKPEKIGCSEILASF